MIKWHNRLPSDGTLPFVTSVTSGDNSADQMSLGAGGGMPEIGVSKAPVGWTTVHLHGAHSTSDSDGFPDNMTRSGGTQLTLFENTYDNMDLDLGKVGEFLWYHDHAMNGTRYHVYAGLTPGSQAGTWSETSMRPSSDCRRVQRRAKSY
jgi:spore coat protein A